jgi:serine/threonine-protein kinase SRPK3
MWSMGCIVFELLTGDLLFDPRVGEGYDRDEDHLAQCIELLGKFPKKLSTTGRYAKNYFDKKGNLKHIQKLRFWPLEEVLREKYQLDPTDAKEAAAFIVPMLDFSPTKRATAKQSLMHPWLSAIKD